MLRLNNSIIDASSFALSSNSSRAVAEVMIVLVLVAGVAFAINSGVTGVQVYNVYPTISMLPTLEVWDLVVVHSVPYSTIHTGDVIVYQRPDQYGGCTSEFIVHRVVNITSQGLITQGDDRRTNPIPDEPTYWPPVPAACVKGVVLVSLPYLGRISGAFPPPYNYVLVVLILVIVFLLELRPSGNKGKEPVGQGSASRGSSQGGQAQTEVDESSSSSSPAPPSTSIISSIGLVLSNIIILVLIYEIFQDYAYRLSYWRVLGFTPSTSYEPFFFVTSARDGATYIAGQLTLDWTQVLLVLLVVIDAYYALTLIRRRRARATVSSP